MTINCARCRAEHVQLHAYIHTPGQLAVVQLVAEEQWLERLILAWPPSRRRWASLACRLLDNQFGWPSDDLVDDLILDGVPASLR